MAEAKAKAVIERRENRRFQVPKDAFVALRPHYLKLGQIVDVGMGGLAFRYLAGEGLVNSSDELDIFLAGRSFYLYQIPFKTVSDLKIEEAPPLGSMKMKRTGIQFGEMTAHQRDQLEYFIHNYAVKEI